MCVDKLSCFLCYYAKFNMHIVFFSYYTQAGGHLANKDSCLQGITFLWIWVIQLHTCSHHSSAKHRRIQITVSDSYNIGWTQKMLRFHDSDNRAILWFYDFTILSPLKWSRLHNGIYRDEWVWLHEMLADITDTETTTDVWMFLVHYLLFQDMTII